MAGESDGTTGRRQALRALRRWGVAWGLVLSLGLSSCSSADQVEPTAESEAALAGSGRSAGEEAEHPEQPAPAPRITQRTVRKRTSIPFRTRTVTSARLEKGVVRIRQRGTKGVRVTVFRVTFRDGDRVRRQRVRTFVARRPVARVRVVGTRVDQPRVASSRRCDPNYAGGCVPIATDVDCGGGSGNGPAYVYGTVRVVGSDIYDLDRDGDGYGCD